MKSVYNINNIWTTNHILYVDVYKWFACSSDLACLSRMVCWLSAWSWQLRKILRRRHISVWGYYRNIALKIYPFFQNLSSHITPLPKTSVACVHSAVKARATAIFFIIICREFKKLRRRSVLVWPNVHINFSEILCHFLKSLRWGRGLYSKENGPTGLSILTCR